MIENYSIRFPNKNVLQKIIDYINFESTNKFTLILNNAYSTAPTSRPASFGKASRSNSILKSKSSPRDEQLPKPMIPRDELVTKPVISNSRLTQIERRRSNIQLDQSMDLNKSLILNESFNADQNDSNEIIEHVLSKVKIYRKFYIKY